MALTNERWARRLGAFAHPIGVDRSAPFAMTLKIADAARAPAMPNNCRSPYGIGSVNLTLRSPPRWRYTSA